MSVGEKLHTGLDAMHRAGVIDDHEHSMAIDADIMSGQHHSIGYELEVFQDAVGNTPTAREVLAASPNPQAEINFYVAQACETAVGPFGYTAGLDGVYELRSPAANHPLPLVISSKGLVRAGWLPQVALGTVTAHISVGLSQEVETGSDKHHRFIRLLRGLDLSGGSSAQRFLAACAGDMNQNWHTKSLVGVATPAACTRISEWRDGLTWEGDRHRLELRSLEYTNLTQFSTLLERVYFLTRACVAPPDSEPGQLYQDFDTWLTEYFNKHKLPDSTSSSLQSNPQDHDTPAARDYLAAYARHFNNPSVIAIQRRLRLLTRKLRTSQEVSVATQA